MKYFEIVELLKKHYPFGVDEIDTEYYKHEGYRCLEQLRFNKLETSDFDNWKIFVVGLKAKYPEIIDVSFDSGLLDSCYTGKLLLFKKQYDALTYSKEFCFHLSLLGPLYCVYGKDIVTSNQSDSLFFDPTITTSPLGEYSQWFSSVRSDFKSNFPSCEFVPFSILQKRVKSLSVAGANVKEGQDSSIFQAVFNSENVTNYRLRGDIFYE